MFVPQFFDEGNGFFRAGCVNLNGHLIITPFWVYGHLECIDLIVKGIEVKIFRDTDNGSQGIIMIPTVPRWGSNNIFNTKLFGKGFINDECHVLVRGNIFRETPPLL